MPSRRRPMCGLSSHSASAPSSRERTLTAKLLPRSVSSSAHSSRTKSPTRCGRTARFSRPTATGHRLSSRRWRRRRRPTLHPRPARSATAPRSVALADPSLRRHWLHGARRWRQRRTPLPAMSHRLLSHSQMLPLLHPLWRPPPLRRSQSRSSPLTRLSSSLTSTASSTRAHPTGATLVGMSLARTAPTSATGTERP